MRLLCWLAAAAAAAAFAACYGKTRGPSRRRGRTRRSVDKKREKEGEKVLVVVVVVLEETPSQAVGQLVSQSAIRRLLVGELFNCTQSQAVYSSYNNYLFEVYFPSIRICTQRWALKVNTVNKKKQNLWIVICNILRWHSIDSID